MGTFVIREGQVLHVNADIDVLEQYARKSKVEAVRIFSYINGVVSMYVTYKDNAVGTFNGVSAGELKEWADSHPKWPAAQCYVVHANFPFIEDEIVATEAAEAEVVQPKRITRSRTVVVEEPAAAEEEPKLDTTVTVKRIRRQR